jgi:hypothetical protein
LSVNNSFSDVERSLKGLNNEKKAKPPINCAIPCLLGNPNRLRKGNFQKTIEKYSEINYTGPI